MAAVEAAAVDCMALSAVDGYDDSVGECGDGKKQRWVVDETDGLAVEEIGESRATVFDSLWCVDEGGAQLRI